jgi:hypothetical protein
MMSGYSSEMILQKYTSVDRELSTIPVAEFPVATDVAKSPRLGLEQPFYMAKLGRWISRESALNWRLPEFSINIMQPTRALQRS